MAHFMWYISGYEFRSSIGQGLFFVLSASLRLMLEPIQYLQVNSSMGQN